MHEKRSSSSPRRSAPRRERARTNPSPPEADPRRDDVRRYGRTRGSWELGRAILVSGLLGCAAPEAPPAAQPRTAPSASSEHGGADPWLTAFRQRAQRDPSDGAVLYN